MRKKHQAPKVLNVFLQSEQVMMDFPAPEAEDLQAVSQSDCIRHQGRKKKGNTTISSIFDYSLNTTTARGSGAYSEGISLRTCSP